MTAPSAATRLVVMPEHDGLRLDQLLAAATSLSRRAARRVIASGLVARNCRPTRVLGKVVDWGDVIDVLIDPAELGVPPRPALPELKTLYDDGWLLGVDKPAGMLSQPSSTPSSELSLDRLTALSTAVAHGAPAYLRMVHRLDRLTSGVALFARNPQAHAPLAHAWATGAVERRYVAVVEGVLDIDETVIDRPIGRDPDHDWRFRVSEIGRDARTLLRVARRRNDGLSVVECRLLTGRTHQVRVHLADLGHPVVGDQLYGRRSADVAPRLMLHAVSLTLPHPKDGRQLVIESPIPDEIRRLMNAER